MLSSIRFRPLCVLLTLCGLLGAGVLAAQDVQMVPDKQDQESAAKAQSDKDAGTVTLNVPDKAAAQKAVDALLAAGYFGISSDPAIKVASNSGAKNGKVQSLKVTGVHLCCNKCVTSVNDALANVAGVKGNTAAKGVESFEVTGDFSEKQVFAALNKAGLSGKAGK